MTLLSIPPGVVNTASKKKNTSNWREANLVRWDDATLRPVGGWEKIDYADLPSRCRKMHAWSDNVGNKYVAYLCEAGCFVDVGGSLIDITPIDGFAPMPSGLGGYGDGSFGTDSYGTERTSDYSRGIVDHCFTLDNWGQELRAMASYDGRYLRWDPSAPGAKLEAVAGAPISNRTFVITPERFAILFGAGGDPTRWEWCDQENDAVWTPAIDNKAGGYNVEPRATILSAKRITGGVMMFTSKQPYIITYEGLPFVYSYDVAGEAPPPISSSSIIEIPDGAIWSALNGFWLYNRVNCVPLTCLIWDWILGLRDFLPTSYQSAMVEVPTKFEVWWLFASTESPDGFNDRAAIYNYKNQNWSMGKLSRSCGAIPLNDPNPIMASGTRIYKHEVGFQYPGAPELPWVETFTLNLSGGSSLSTIHQMLPEVVGDYSAIQFQFYKSNNPSDASQETISAAKLVRSNGYVDVRETARDFRMRIEMVKNLSWSVGPIDITVKMRGQK